MATSTMPLAGGLKNTGLTVTANHATAPPSCGTGNVKTTHNVSVFDNPVSVINKGFEPNKIDMSKISDKLKIIQRGNDLKHFEIVPAQPMPLVDYINELAKIKTY